MAGLNSMKNIGKELERKLTAVGVDSPEALKELGAKHAFFKLKGVLPQVCLVRLYAREGAVQDMEFNSLPEDKKRELKEFSDFLKR